MKPNQAHKDPRITNISFDNFTGTICIFTPFSDDEESEDFMLSSAQTNAGTDLFKSNHHLALITQPLLGARSRRKEKTDSTTTSRHSSYNSSPSLIFPTNRGEKFHNEKRINHPESSDSGLDYSLSTNSSVQYPQQQPTSIHRPLSALNEDSNTDDGFSDQPIRRPVLHLGYYRSMENIITANHSNSSSKEQEKLIKKSNDDDSIAEINQQTNSNRMEFLHSSLAVQQHRSCNNLTNTTQTNISKQKKRSRKKAKLNIIIEPSASSISSSHLHIHDEQLHTINRITSSKSSNQMTSHSIRTGNESIKPKAMTPLGYYPNSEQTRAHINQSVLDRQHPPRKAFIQQNIPFDATPSKVMNLPFRQGKPPTNPSHSNPNAHEGNSTIPNSHVVSSRQIKQILPNFYHEERNPIEKRRSIEMNKWQDNSQKDPLRIKAKDVQELFKTNRPNHLDNFLTSTPRRPHQTIGANFKEQQPMNPTYRSKPTGFVLQNKIRRINPKPAFDSDHSPSKALLHPPIMENQIEQIHQLGQKSLAGSVTKLFRTARILPMNMNHFRRENEPHRLLKTNLVQLNKVQGNSNRFFPTRSPASRSILSDHQIHQYQSSSSSSIPENQIIDDQLNTTDRLDLTDEQQLLDGRYVIPAINSELPTILHSASQSSSRNTPPFICTTDSKHNNNLNVDHSSHELTASNKLANVIHHRSCSSSSPDRFSPKDRFPLPLGKVTVAMEEDHISTNYDSDDGWSDASAELLYIDERYITQKKKNISSS